MNFNIKYASKGGGGSGNACIYKVEVRRASDNSLLATLDHSASPLCSTGTTYRVVNENISSYVTSTDVANDLRVKVFGYETGGKGWNIEYATVTGTSYASWTLFEKTVTDQSTGTGTTTPWVARDRRGDRGGRDDLHGGEQLAFRLAGRHEVPAAHLRPPGPPDRRRLTRASPE